MGTRGHARYPGIATHEGASALGLGCKLKIFEFRAVRQLGFAARCEACCARRRLR